jgi:D-tagatose-1,6-bisphosphate aldolase subunit GatZ/KbaZ
MTRLQQMPFPKNLESLPDNEYIHGGREPMNGTEILRDIITARGEGQSRGIYSICSSHPVVIDASLEQALHDDSALLIESTSNQVNQFGGYTGMTPVDFRDYVLSRCRGKGMDERRVILGGDHLGPTPFKSEPAGTAMDKACAMVRDFVTAGFVKIHLDTSIPLGNEDSIEASLVAERCARLCSVCEQAHSSMGDDYPEPLYIIGTEVPVPGGSDEVEEGVEVTSVSDLEETFRLNRDAFVRENLHSAWERVIAVVVQPGVEFGDHRILEYNRTHTHALSQKLNDLKQVVYEAHSTDYQTPSLMREMVEDGFAILKVGPGLTYAFREAVFMLCAMESELCRLDHGMIPSALMETIEDVMLRNPRYWEGYYTGTESEQAYKRRYSLFDRIRYYWNDEQVKASYARLLNNMEKRSIPETLISQYFPSQYSRVRDGLLDPEPEILIRDRVREVVADYAYATGMLVRSGF